MPPALTWLVRHAESTVNAGQPAVGFDEAPLTDRGRVQASELARRVERQPDLLVVSPFLRAQETAAPIRTRWSAIPCEIWPIQELTYLSPARCMGTTADVRRPWIEAYWQRCDPDYLDGPDAESFASFMARLAAFDERLAKLAGGFVIAVGHGQFFRAYLWAREKGFDINAARMREYRVSETSRAMRNAEVIELSAP